MGTALIAWGGWEGHQPREVADLFAEMLSAEGFTVEMGNGTATFERIPAISDLELVIPVITMAKIEPAQRQFVWDAVIGGVGLAGCHGGMCDAFREDCEWQFMTGGQWVAHPGDSGVTYTVEIRDAEHPITAGLANFEITSEQYYLHTDPGNRVLATTRFPWPGVDGPHVANPCDMPVVWTKSFGRGKVFYNSLGHQRVDLELETPRELMRRGFLWATGRL